MASVSLLQYARNASRVEFFLLPGYLQTAYLAPADPATNQQPLVLAPLDLSSFTAFIIPP